MKFRSKLALAALVCFALLSTTAAFGAVIEEVIIFGDFDTNGNIVPSDVFTPADDIVGIWFNLSDVNPGDNIIIEWWPPSGDLYKVHNWTAPSWVQPNSDWDMWEDMEIMGDPAENMPGVWAADITVNGTWWGHAAFEIVKDGSTGTDSGSGSDDEVIRGYYIEVTEVRPVGNIVLGQNVTIEVDIKYNFLEVPLVPTIMDQNYEIRGDTSDTIQGSEEKTYTITMWTTESDESMYFAAVAYYYIDGNWTYQEPWGVKPFTLEGGGVIPDGIKLPEGIDFSDIDVDEIASTLNDTIQKGLDKLKDVIPDDLSEIEDEVRERTGIPGFPMEALLLGASTLVYALRRRD